MCGLTGIRNYAGGGIDVDALVRMQESMRSRGPDGAGLWCDHQRGIGLAHRRLAIIDLSERAAQPMGLEEAQLQVVFNGEIYNHQELRAWCKSRGAHYVTDSDTETLLHLYALEGEQFVRRLRGMFAFALWDGRTRTLLLARDPFGIKPLYYTNDGRELRFASQVKSLISGGADDRISPAGLASFFLWGYVTEPHTWHSAVRAVPSGSMMVFRADGQFTIKSYSNPLDQLRQSQEPAAESSSLRDAVLGSVKHHLLADVPVGLFLSAGLDSGTLCALVAECTDPASVRGITLGFDSYAGTRNDEAPLANVLAKHYGCRHQVVRYRRGDFEGAGDQLITAMDQPTVDGVNTYFVSKAASAAGLKVALSGVGGDELFGGYPSFTQVPRLARMLCRVPRSAGRAMRALCAPIVSKITSPKHAGLLEYGGSVTGAYLLRRALFMPWEIASVIGPDLALAGLEELDVLGSLERVIHDIDSPYAQVMALEHSIYLKNCLLRDSDWAGMAHSLEIRTPLVDATLFAQLAYVRHHGLTYTKGDWAETPSRRLPEEVRNRPKTGFTVPIREWLDNSDCRGAQERGRRGWARRVARFWHFDGRDSKPRAAEDAC
jgi:asparagine synthase (glutamine-hydrolysing)